MVENQRNTANFGISPISPSQNFIGNELVLGNRSGNMDINPEGFQFSFNDNSKEGNFDSKDPSPSPQAEMKKTIPEIGDELSHLQMKVKEINSRLEHNLQVLKEKQTKNESLKKLLDYKEARSTFPTDGSFIEQGCACNKVCGLF